MDELPLPGMPEPPRSKKPKTAPTGVRLSRYKVKHRRLCDECVRLIHQLGVADAPYPRAARWKRSAGVDDQYLCEAHKEIL